MKSKPTEFQFFKSPMKELTHNSCASLCKLIDGSALQVLLLVSLKSEELGDESPSFPSPSRLTASAAASAMTPITMSGRSRHSNTHTV